MIRWFSAKIVSWWKFENLRNDKKDVFFIDNNLSSKNAFYQRRVSFVQAHFLIFIKYYLVIIQATKIFHYQMHQLIMMNSLTIPNGHT